MSASTLAKHLSDCGLQELRVGEGDNYHHYNNYIFFADTKFRKGLHQALPLLEQEQQEEDIDNIFDIDICMIETEEDNTTNKTTATTTSPTPTTSTEKTAMQDPSRSSTKEETSTTEE